MLRALRVLAFGIVKHLQIVFTEHSNQLVYLDRLNLAAGASAICGYGERLQALHRVLTTRSTKYDPNRG